MLEYKIIDNILKINNTQTSINILDLLKLNFSKLEITNCDKISLNFSGVKDILFDIEIKKSTIDKTEINGININGELNINECKLIGDFKIINSYFNKSFFFHHNYIDNKEINIQNSYISDFDFYLNHFKILTILNSKINSSVNTNFYIKDSYGNEFNLHNSYFTNIDLSNSRIEFIDFRNNHLLNDFNYINFKDLVCDKKFYINCDKNFFDKANFTFYLSRIDNFICDNLDLYKINLLSEKIKLGLIDNKYFLDKIDINYIILNEKRTLLEIYNKLNIFENKDKIFIEIMNLKLELKNNKYIFYIKFIFLNYILGWGIKIKNLFAFISLYILSFGIFYEIFYINILDLYKINGYLFSFLSFFSIILPEKDITKLDGTIIYFSGLEAISGTFFITLFIAMLTRKFMKI